jgi:acetolactate synthase-1/2/3 large subunit
MRKYSEYVSEWLSNMGYTHCFFVPGGNSMHLLDGFRKTMECIPFVHEMSAAIAAEYFNVVTENGRALVLLTAGPGLTNALTGIAGAFHEGRELLVIGGQVKTTDLTDGSIRQRGIQEVDGVSLAAPISVKSHRMMTPYSREDFESLVNTQWESTPGPVFIEICLDVQGAPFDDTKNRPALQIRVDPPDVSRTDLEALRAALEDAQRPLFLVGGGVSQSKIDDVLEVLTNIGIPVMTTYNGADRVPSDHPLYFGRPNTWGMRYSNILLAQSDLVVALGTRMGLQQTGFNWKEMLPNGRLVHVDISHGELHKGHPVSALKIQADAASVILGLNELRWQDTGGWTEFCRLVKASLPLSESCNNSFEGFHNPYDFLLELSSVATGEDLIVPCSSGGAFTAFYQAFLNKRGQRIVSNKSLASMGYGLAGAVGAALAHPERRILHTEGDGGFSQNLQELATVGVRNLNIKTFLWCNDGYASIRMTQKNYFNGDYLGCDIDTGLGFPDWFKLGDAYGIPVIDLKPGFSNDEDVLAELARKGPQIYLVKLHREQSFLPKISSRITPEGGMESEPLWQISPHLSGDLQRTVYRFVSGG